MVLINNTLFQNGNNNDFTNMWKNVRATSANQQAHLRDNVSSKWKLYFGYEASGNETTELATRTRDELF